METKKQLLNRIADLEHRNTELLEELKRRVRSGAATPEECEGALCMGCAYAVWSTYNNTTYPDLIGCARNIRCKDFKPVRVIEQEGSMTRAVILGHKEPLTG